MWISALWWTTGPAIECWNWTMRSLRYVKSTLTVQTSIWCKSWMQAWHLDQWLSWFMRTSALLWKTASSAKCWNWNMRPLTQTQTFYCNWKIKQYMAEVEIKLIFWHLYHNDSFLKQITSAFITQWLIQKYKIRIHTSHSFAKLLHYQQQGPFTKSPNFLPKTRWYYKIHLTPKNL